MSFIDRRPSQLALMHERFPEALERALDADRQESYYGREWRLSEPAWDERDGVVYAQLGFRRRTRHAEIDYDDEKHVWISSESPARQGNFAHFVIDLNSQLLAFEDRGTDLKRDSFLHVLKQFLAKAGLEANLLSDAREFEAWLSEVDRVTRFRVTLRQPNPGYSKRARQVRELAGEVEAERLTIEAESSAGLNVRDTLLDGAADTASLGNGSYRATGFVGDKRRFFDSAKRFVSGVIEVVQGDSAQTIGSKIRDLMNEIAPEVPRHRPDEDAHPDGDV
ncbi:hypothetical protein GKE82_21760 [Conexibacter sp. W3-3-2]|nr:hypothetical protein [Conexibacter sp. W3-3-2]